jgi:hypothetical protein
MEEDEPILSLQEFVMSSLISLDKRFICKMIMTVEVLEECASNEVDTILT